MTKVKSASLQALTSQEAEHYLPWCTSSPKMVTVPAASSTTDGTFTDDNATALSRFDSVPDKSGNSHTFFAGGPIWASDWCPKPASDKSQLLAISTDCNPDALDLMVIIFKNPLDSMLQSSCEILGVPGSSLESHRFPVSVG